MTIVSDLEFGRAQLLKAIDGLSQRELTEMPIYAGWTVKDVLAHILGWDQWVLCTLPLLLENRGDEVPAVEVDEYNQKAVETWGDKTVVELLAELKVSHRQIMDIFSGLDHKEIDLRRERLGRIITIRSYVINVMIEHERKHAMEIETWRKTLDQALDLAALKASLVQYRTDFWEALHGLHEVEAQDKAAIAGWSVQDVVGHIAVWEQLIFKAARHIHDPSWPSPPPAGPNEDEWNQAQASQRAHHTWREETEQLRLIQTDLDEFIARLTPGDWRLRGPYPWPNDQGSLAELIGHAVEHYPDHLPDLQRWRSQKLSERPPSQPWLPWLLHDEASGLLKAEYEAAIRRAGKVWHILRAMSLNPEALQAARQLYSALLPRAAGRLGRAEREMIAVVVSQTNHCPYSTQAHLHDLRAEVNDDEFVAKLAQDWRAAGLPPPTQAALTLAEKLTRTPGQMTQDDIRGLRRQGFSDEEIQDIVQIVAYFNYINRLANGLGVPPEDFMTPWPRQDGDW
ncbi:MAG: peroxidase-related enzyme [Chloroflexota bacterium]